MARPRRRVDRAALRRVDEHVAVRPEGFAGEVRPPAAGAAGGVHGQVPGGFAAGRRDGRERGRVATAEHLDHAGQRIAPVEIRPTALQHLDTLDLCPRHAAPVDPATERVVGGDAVHQHQRPAGAAGSDAPQRDPLRGRVRRAAARSPEEREPRHLAERVVERERSRRVESPPVQHENARGGVTQPGLAPSGRDRDLLGPDWARRLVGRRTA